MKAIRAWLMFLLVLMAPMAASLAAEYPEGTLHRGMEGRREEVEFLQYQLFYTGYLGDDVSAVDGVFGRKTEAAVRQFQKEHGIDVTGIVCPNTQNALNRAWEAAMEAQGGEPDPHSGCYKVYYANDNAYLVLCQRHKLLHEKASALRSDEQNMEQAAEAMQAGVDLWLEEIDSLYQYWMENQQDQTELIAAVQETCIEHYRANLALWNVHFGPAPSYAALDKAYTMLSAHAAELCCMLEELY